jgi:hypothetical protein
MCNRIKGVMVSDDYKTGYRTLVRIRCEMWGCPDCGPINAQRWRAYLLKRFNDDYGHVEWCFYTITAHKNAHKNTAMSVLNLQQVWKRLYDRLRRRFPNKRLEYVRVFEPHKSGRFHMHMLLNVGEEYDKHGFVIKDKLDEYRHPECVWLRNTCASLGGGWRVHIRRVWDDIRRSANVGLVVGYIVKYMGKQMADFAFPKHQRRIQTSRNIGSPNTSARGQGTWKHMREVSQDEFLRGKPMLDMSTGEVLTIASFEGEHYYPPLRFYRGEGRPTE